MLKRELLTIFKSKKSRVFIIMLLLIPMFDILLNISSCYLDYWLHPNAYPDGNIDVFAPCMAAFLSGRSEGHIAQMLYIWILPLYLLIIYCDNNILEVNSGINSVLFAKCKKSDFVKTKMVVSFVLPFAISFVGVSINFILANIIFINGTDYCGIDRYAQTEYANSVVRFSIESSTLSYIIYIFLFSIISGLCGMMCQGLAFIVHKYSYLYMISFVIWFLLIINKYSITYCIQPFIEYGIEYMLIGLCIFVFATVGCALTGGYCYYCKP